MLLARTALALEEVADKIATAGGEAKTYTVDLSDVEAATATARMIEGEQGIPDVIVNNAGAGRWLATDETAPMAVPYFAAFALTRAFLPGMIARGSGHIVNMTSLAAFVPVPGTAAYTASRWAVRGFTEELRMELRGTGVDVTLVAPAKVASPYFEHNPGTEERMPGIAKLYPTLSAEQVANAIVRAVEARRKLVFGSASVRATVYLHRLLPWSVEWLVEKTGWSRQKRP